MPDRIPGSPRFTALERHVAVTSTNDVALERLRAGAPIGLVVAADAQTAGRGRAGTSWQDDVRGPDGPANLAVTASTRAPRVVGLVPLVAALAVADAYASAGAAPILKWPNDVLLGDRKAAGVLVERHDLGDDVVLIGCGLDLDWRGVDRVGEQQGWTSLAEVLGGPVDREAVLTDLLESLATWLDRLESAPDPVLDAYRDRCGTLGAQVEVQLPDGSVIRGRASDLDPGGHLVVSLDGGTRTVVSGEVRYVRAAG